MHSLAYFFEPGSWLGLTLLCMLPRSLLFSIILFILHCIRMNVYKSGATMQRHERALNLIIITTTIEPYSFSFFEMRSQILFSNFRGVIDVSNNFYRYGIRFMRIKYLCRNGKIRQILLKCWGWGVEGRTAKTFQPNWLFACRFIWYFFHTSTWNYIN